MLHASILSFDKGDNSALIKIFSKAITPVLKSIDQESDSLNILTADDLAIDNHGGYDYCEYDSNDTLEEYNKYYQTKIQDMNSIIPD